MGGRAEGGTDSRRVPAGRAGSVAEKAGAREATAGASGLDHDTAADSKPGSSCRRSVSGWSAACGAAHPAALHCRDRAPRGKATLLDRGRTVTLAAACKGVAPAATSLDTVTVNVCHTPLASAPAGSTHTLGVVSLSPCAALEKQGAGWSSRRHSQLYDRRCAAAGASGSLEAEASRVRGWESGTSPEGPDSSATGEEPTAVSVTSAEAPAEASSSAASAYRAVTLSRTAWPCTAGTGPGT